MCVWFIRLLTRPRLRIRAGGTEVDELKAAGGRRASSCHVGLATRESRSCAENG